MLSDEESAERMAQFAAITEYNILTYGHSVLGVFATKPEEQSFSYTVGLSDSGWPEIILVGMSSSTGGALLNDLVETCRRRERPPQVGEVFREVANLPVAIGQCSPQAVEEYLCQAVYRAQGRAGPPVTAVQLVLSDSEGRLPGHPHYDRAYMDPRQICLSPTGRWDTFQENEQ